jgi:polar amino acid transport system substrate-binding protein
MASDTGLERANLDRRSFLVKGAIVAGGAGLLLAGCGSSTASAAANATTGKLQAVISRKKLLVGTGVGNPPWHFQDNSGNLTGFDIAMGHIVANALFADPNAVEYVQETSDARIPNLLTNKVDVIFQFMTVTALRAQQVEFTIPYYREGVALMLPASSQYADYKAIKAAGSAVTISVLQNADAAAMVALALPQAKILQIDTQANVMQAADSGRVDAAAVDQSTVRWLLVQQPGKYKDTGYGWYPQTYAAAVQPGDAIWLNFLNTALHEAMTGVDFQSYAVPFKTYFGQDLPTPTIGFPMEFAAKTAA